MLPIQESPKLSKAESARINGAKSTGPATSEGKINSANANLKHGAYSKRILMDGEIPEAYEHFKSCFYQVFQPADAFEAECVDSMVIARWRIRRLESTETSNLNIALASNKDRNAANFDALDILHERAVAVQSQIPSIDVNTRVEERLHRIYDRNYKLLANYRRKSGHPIPASVPRKPAAEPPVPASGDLTDRPNSKPAANPNSTSIIAKAAFFLVIFAILLLTPAGTMSKTFASQPSRADFHTFHSPDRNSTLLTHTAGSQK